MQSSGYGCMRDGRRGRRARPSFTEQMKEISPQRSQSSQRRQSCGESMMTKTAGELAAAIGAKLNGDKDFEVRGVAAPERAGEHDLIYIEAAKHSERAATSAAGCVIAADDVTMRGKTVLRHAQPEVAVAKAASVLGDAGPIAAAMSSPPTFAP